MKSDSRPNGRGRRGNAFNPESRAALPAKIKKPRRLNFYKCQFCRRDKKKCEPIGRMHPEKCKRCIEKGFDCSEPQSLTQATTDVSQDQPLHTAEDISDMVSAQIPATEINGSAILDPQRLAALIPTGTGAVSGPETSTPLNMPLQAGSQWTSLDNARVDGNPSLTARDRSYNEGREEDARHPTISQPQLELAGSRQPVVGATQWRHSSDEPSRNIGSRMLVNRGSSHNKVNWESIGGMKLFACPFYKFNPVANFHCFTRCSLKRMSDLRQHLLRSHSTAPYHCSNCWEQWQVQESWFAHMIRGDCQKRPGPNSDQLTPDEFETLRSIPRGLSDEEKWYWMWEKIFPTKEPPISPYVNEGFIEPMMLLRSRAEVSIENTLPEIMQHFHININKNELKIFKDELIRICFNTDAMLDQADRFSGPPLEISHPRWSHRQAHSHHDMDIANSALPLHHIYESLPTLSENISKAFLPTWNDKMFLPSNMIHHFVTLPTIAATFEQQGIEIHQAIEEYIIRGAPHIFLILVLMDRLNLWEGLASMNIKDDVLPLKFIQNDTGCVYAYPVEKDSLHRDTYALRGWNHKDCDLFDLYQSAVFVPVFKGTQVTHLNISHKRTLPYLMDTEQSCAPCISGGFFGQVKKMVIHRSHIEGYGASMVQKLGLTPEDPKSIGIPVAISTLCDAHDTKFSSLSNTESLKESGFCCSCSHSLKPIASYRLENDLHLIFPWADGGHLGNYWESLAEGPLDTGRVIWTIKQLVHICEDINILHKSSRRHGAIKPNNILWFKKAQGDGVLCIVDQCFGSLEAHQPDGVSLERLGSRKCSHSPTCEGYFQCDHRPHSSMDDIWSLGLVLVETLVWLIYGYQDLLAFQQRAKPYFWKQTGQDKYKMSLEVENCFETIARNKEIGETHQKLLNVIQRQLLAMPGSSSRRRQAEHQENVEEALAAMEKILEDSKRDIGHHLPVESLARSSRLYRDDFGHRTPLLARHELAREYLDNGHAEEAVRILEDGDSTRNTLVKDPTPSLALKRELARAYLATGRVEEAVGLLEEVLNWRKSLPEDDPSRLLSQYELSWAYLADRQAKKAIRLLENVVPIERERFGGKGPCLMSQHALAVAYKYSGRVEDAINLLEQVVLRRENFDERHPDRLSAQHELAAAYLANKQPEKGILLLERVVFIERDGFEKDDPDRLASLHELATAYLANGQVVQAVELLELVVFIERESLSDDNPSRLASVKGLARAYQENGQMEKAVRLLLQVVSLKKTRPCLKLRYYPNTPGLYGSVDRRPKLYRSKHSF